MPRTIKLSASKLRCYKSCRRKYFLKYIAEVPMPTSAAQSIGKNYHEEIAKLLRGEEFAPSPMANAFKSYITLPPIKAVEEYFEIKIGYGVVLDGYMDAVTQQDNPVEHKTSSSPIDEKYIYRLNFDEQISTYLTALSLRAKKAVTKAHYTAIQKPTIRQKQNETPEEYETRCNEWYKDGTENKVRTFTVVRSIEEQDRHLKEILAIGKEIRTCKNFYRNQEACMILSCPFENVCLDNYIEIKEEK